MGIGSRQGEADIVEQDGNAQLHFPWDKEVQGEDGKDNRRRGDRIDWCIGFEGT